nr:hypothetical protein Itr_chr06CG17620 [Ipomoea trifida]
MQERIRGYDFSFFPDVVPSAKVALDQRSSNWTSAVKPRAAANQQQETVNQIPSPLIDDRPWTEPATATVAVELAQRLTGDGAPDGDLPCFDEVRHERERQQRWKPLAPTATQAVTLPRLFFVQRQGYSPLIFPSRAKVALDQRSSNWTSAVKPRAAANQQQETVNQIPSPLIDDRPWTEPATATVAVELAQRLTGDGAPDGDLPCFDEVRHERERQQRWKPLAPTATQAVTLSRLFFVQRQGYSPLIFPSRYRY